MPKQPSKVTVFIPTYNGEKYLEELLSMVYKQVLPFKFEVLVIDSGSKDSTLDIVSKYPDIKLKQIPNSEFGHGRTRNLAAELSPGSTFMVYLSQDAVPAHERWLEFMLEPFFIDERIVAVVGNQKARHHCDITTKREVNGVFSTLGPDHSIMIHRSHSLTSSKDASPALTFFSDVNSAVRRDFLINKLPYRDVPYSEDQLLGSDILKEGYMKAYSPRGLVMHSNEYGIRDYFYRKHDEYMGMFSVLGVVPARSVSLRLKRAVGDTLRDIFALTRDKEYTLKQKFYNLLTCWIRNIEKEYAAHLMSSPAHRKRIGSKLSLEARNKN